MARGLMIARQGGDFFSKHFEALKLRPTPNSEARSLRLRVDRKLTMTSINLPLNAKCVATSGDAFCRTIEECDAAWSHEPRSHRRDAGSWSNFFHQAHFSGDGTTIVTQNEDQCLRTFVLPADLLNKSEHPSVLAAYSVGPSPTQIQSYAVYPYFDLSDPSTTLVLSASADQPIALKNALDYSTIHAKYQHVNPLTEEYIRSNSLAFTRDGRHFISGSKNQIAIFDCSYDGSAPVSTQRTSVSRKARQLYGAPSLSCKGIISALSISGDGVLAVGTNEREIGLYEQEGKGECITAFAVDYRPDEPNVAKGSGITSLKWSPCGRYLLAAERQCDCIQVWDIRNTLQWVSRLTGREADTTQKLGMDVVPTADGYEVWAGGMDGCVRMWSNPGSQGGEHGPNAEMKLHDGRHEIRLDRAKSHANTVTDPVSSAVWHPGGAVLATSSGQRSASYDSEDSSSSGSEEADDSEAEGRSLQPGEPPRTTNPDNRLNVWVI